MLSVKFFQTVYAHQAMLLARLPSTIILRGYPPTVPLAPHAHWCALPPDGGKRALGMGMHARDACKGIPAKGYQQGMWPLGDVAMGVSSAYGLLPVVYQEATC